MEITVAGLLLSPYPFPVTPTHLQGEGNMWALYSCVCVYTCVFYYMFWWVGIVLVCVCMCMYMCMCVCVCVCVCVCIHWQPQYTRCGGGGFLEELYEEDQGSCFQSDGHVCSSIWSRDMGSYQAGTPKIACLPDEMLMGLLE